MPGTTHPFKDAALEEHGPRKSGLLGRGKNANKMFAISYYSLPEEAKSVLDKIKAGGPFKYKKDGVKFQNKFGDLPSGDYREFTVETPGVKGRGARRIVARVTTGQLFFTACHYERVQDAKHAAGGVLTAMAADADWANGFYIITGLSAEARADIVRALKAAYPPAAVVPAIGGVD